MTTQVPQPQPPFVLTIDIGTSSSRAILFDARGAVVPNCVAQITNHLKTTNDGGATFEIAELEQNVVEAIDRVLLTAGPLANQIGAVTMATLVGNILGTDRHGEPMTPVYTYADTRNVDAADALRTQLGDQGQTQIHNRTGCLIHSSYLPARFRWLEEVEPALLKAVSHWLSIGEYLLWRFLGQRVASYSIASWNGLLNRRSLHWDDETLDLIGLDPAKLSPLVDIDEPLIGLQTGWANRWPALANARWIVGIGDGAAANVGSGCGQIGGRGESPRMALTIGTTGALRVVVDADRAADDVMPSGLWLYRVDRKRGLLGGATTEGGNVYAWLSRTLQLPDEQSSQALATRIPAQHGLTVLPFVAGERAPGWKGDARASIIGFSLNTQPIDILQASLEAIAYRFAIIFQRITETQAVQRQLNASSAEKLQIIASGGALLRSPAWLQIMADVLNQPVTALEEGEISARGLALLGLQQLGIIQSTSELQPQFGKTYLPNIENHQIHQAAIQRQVEMYEKLI